MPPQDGLKFLFDIQDKISAKLVKIEAKSKSSAAKIDKAFTRASKSQETGQRQIAAAVRRTEAATKASARNRIKWEKQYERALKERARHQARVAKAAESIRQKVRLGLAALGVALAAGVKAFAALAFETVESQALVSESFGTMTTDAKAWAAELSDSLGLNRFESERMSAVLFTMTENMGLSKEAAFDLSTGAVELAADMASFYNLSHEEVLDKIKAGLTGEAEPLKRLGILVNENTIKQTAYNAGIAKRGAVLTETQKVEARWLAITKQTTKAQGDLARTMDSPTNKLRRMRSELMEAATTLSQALLPALSWGVDLLSGFGGAVADVSRWLADSKPTLAVIATLIGVTLLVALKAGALALWAMVPPVTALTGGINLIIPLIALLAAAGVGAWVKWGDSIKDFIRKVWVKLLDNIGAGLQKISGFVRHFNIAWADSMDSAGKSLRETAAEIVKTEKVQQKATETTKKATKATKKTTAAQIQVAKATKKTSQTLKQLSRDWPEATLEGNEYLDMISEVAAATPVATVEFGKLQTGLHEAAEVMSTELYEAAKDVHEKEIELAESTRKLDEEQRAATESASGYDLALAGMAGQMGGATGQAINLVIAMREHNKEQRAAARAGKETEQEFSKIQQGAAMVGAAFTAIGDAIGGTAGKVLSELGGIAQAFATGGIVGGIMAGIGSLVKGIKGLFGRGKKKREAAAKAAKEAADVAAKAAEEAAVAAAKIAAAMEDIRLGLLGMPTQAVTEDFRLLRDVWNGMNAAERAQGMDRYVAALQAASAAGIVLTGVEQELLDAFVAYNTAMAEASSRQDAEMAALRTRQEAEMAGIDAQIDAIESRLRPKVSVLQGLLDQQKAELDSLSARQDAEVAALTARRKESLDALKTWQSEQLSILQETQRKALDDLKASQDAEISSIKAARAAALGVFESAIQRELEDERIAAQLKIDIRKAGMDQEAYEAALARAEEATERLLERDELNEAMAEAEARIRERYQHELDAINAHWDKVEAVTTERFQSELTEMEGAHADQLTELEASQATQLQLYNGFWDSLELGMESRHAVELATMEAAHVAQLEALQSYFVQQRDALAAANAVELSDMQTSHDARLAEIERYWAAARQAVIDGAAAIPDIPAPSPGPAPQDVDPVPEWPGFQDPEGFEGYQHGGPVRAGRPVLVGEAGPELFIPSQSGRIDPNVSSAGGGVNAKELAKAVSEALQNTRIEVDGRQLGRLTIRHQPIAVAELGGRR